jgi:hypothetical protein
MMIQTFFGLLLGLIAISTPVSAVPTSSSPASASIPSSSFDGNTFGIREDDLLDQEAINRAYKDSEWEAVVSTLQGYLRKYGDDQVSVHERIYAYKYLGIIFGADSLYRAKSESYFTRLVELSPKVEILDLFPSKRVTDIFDQVKFEHKKRTQYVQQFDEYGYETGKGSSNNSNPQTALAKRETPQERKRGNSTTTPRQSPSLQEKKQKWVWWTIGLTAAVGAGIGIYYLASQPGEGEKIITDVGN